MIFYLLLLYIIVAFLTFCVMAYLLGTLGEEDGFEGTLIASIVWPVSIIVMALIVLFKSLAILYEKLHTMGIKQVK